MSIKHGVLLGALLAPLYVSAAAQPSCPKPEWPAEARRYELEGKATMAFRLAPDGQVVDARVAKSSGWSLLDAASVRGLSACHFKPRDPQPAEVSREMKMQYVWKLEGPFNHPKVVDGTCEASRKIDRFEPDDTGVTDERGMLVRLLVSAEGRPYGIKAEGDTVSPEGFEQAAAYLQTCRFRTDLGRAGKPTDTVTGRVIYK